MEKVAVLCFFGANGKLITSLQAKESTAPVYTTHRILGTRYLMCSAATKQDSGRPERETQQNP